MSSLSNNVSSLYCHCYSTTTGKAKWNSCILIQSFYVRTIPNINLTVVFLKTSSWRKTSAPRVTRGSLEGLHSNLGPVAVGTIFLHCGFNIEHPACPLTRVLWLLWLLRSTIQAWGVHLTSQVCTKASDPSISVRLKCIPTMKHKDRRIFPLKYLLLPLSQSHIFLSKCWEKSDYLHPRHNL